MGPNSKSIWGGGARDVSIVMEETLPPPPGQQSPLIIIIVTTDVAQVCSESASRPFVNQSKLVVNVEVFLVKNREVDGDVEDWMFF